MIIELLVDTQINMDNIYKSIEEYNPNKKRKVLTVFDNTIADMLSNNRIGLTRRTILL